MNEYDLNDMRNQLDDIQDCKDKIMELVEYLAKTYPDCAPDGVEDAKESVKCTLDDAIFTGKMEEEIEEAERHDHQKWIDELNHDYYSNLGV